MNDPAIAPHFLWLIAGVLLCSAEMLVPGVYLLWIGLAALLTGLAAWLLPIGVEIEVALFAVSAIASVFAGRRWTASGAIASDDPLLNDRAGRLIGEVVTLVDSIESGHGRARVGDSVWSVRGPDAPAGTHVRIVGAQGTELLVEIVA